MCCQLPVLAILTWKKEPLVPPLQPVWKQYAIQYLFPPIPWTSNTEWSIINDINQGHCLLTELEDNMHTEAEYQAKSFKEESPLYKYILWAISDLALA